MDIRCEDLGKSDQTEWADNMAFFGSLFAVFPPLRGDGSSGCLEGPNVAKLARDIAEPEAGLPDVLCFLKELVFIRGHEERCVSEDQEMVVPKERTGEGDHGLVCATDTSDWTLLLDGNRDIVGHSNLSFASKRRPDGEPWTDGLAGSLLRGYTRAHCCSRGVLASGA